MTENKLTSFTLADGQNLPLKYVESMEVKQGVVCDVYSIINDETKDFAIVRVEAGQHTPKQRILKGKKTVEGYVSGKSTLTILRQNKKLKKYSFPDEELKEIEVKVGDIMQWRADTEFVFYEICDPPYKDGRFEDLKGVL